MIYCDLLRYIAISLRYPVIFCDLLRSLTISYDLFRSRIYVCRPISRHCETSRHPLAFISAISRCYRHIIIIWSAFRFYGQNSVVFAREWRRLSGARGGDDSRYGRRTKRRLVYLPRRLSTPAAGCRPSRAWRGVVLAS